MCIRDSNYNELLKHKFVHFRDLEDAKTILIGIDSKQLFEHVQQRMYIFVKTVDGELKLKNSVIANQSIVNEFTKKCHKITLENGKEVYLFYKNTIVNETASHPLTLLDSNVLSDNQISKSYPVITLPNEQYIIIEGFLINVTTGAICEFYSSSTRSALSDPVWNILRKGYDCSMLDKFLSFQSNYYIINDPIFFKVVDHANHCRLAYKKEKDTFVCRVVKLRKDATNLGHSIYHNMKGVISETKYVILAKLQFGNGSREDLFAMRSQYSQELNFINRVFANDIKLLEEELVQRVVVSGTQMIPYHVRNIPAKILNPKRGTFYSDTITESALCLYDLCEDTEQYIIFDGVRKKRCV